MAENTAVAIAHSQSSIIKMTPFETALQRQKTLDCSNRIGFLKSLYLRNLLMFIEEELGLRVGYACYKTFIGDYHKIQTRALCTYCGESAEDLFKFVSYMESCLLFMAQERINRINRIKKFLFFLPVLGWCRIAIYNREFWIGQYNRGIISTLQIKKELENYSIDSKDIILDIARHNTNAYVIHNWIDWY